MNGRAKGSPIDARLLDKPTPQERARLKNQDRRRFRLRAAHESKMRPEVRLELGRLRRPRFEIRTPQRSRVPHDERRSAAWPGDCKRGSHARHARRHADDGRRVTLIRHPPRLPPHDRARSPIIGEAQDQRAHRCHSKPRARQRRICESLRNLAKNANATQLQILAISSDHVNARLTIIA